MEKKDKNAINRRDFVMHGTVAAVAANYLGLGRALVYGGPGTPLVIVDAVDIMKVAAASVLEINQFFKRAAAEIDDMKKTKAEAIEKAECTKVLSIISAVVLVVVACVIAAVTFGAGSPMSAAMTAQVVAVISKQLGALDQWEAEITKQNKMTPEIRAAIQRFREITANVKDVVVARDVFFHLSQDKAHATKLLEAVRAKNRAAIEELLRLDASGRTVVVQDAKEDNGLFLNVRIGNLTHCFSTAAQCSGKQLTFTK